VSFRIGVGNGGSTGTTLAQKWKVQITRGCSGPE
jgi:hypothetical protein